MNRTAEEENFKQLETLNVQINDITHVWFSIWQTTVINFLWTWSDCVSCCEAMRWNDVTHLLSVGSAASGCSRASVWSWSTLQEHQQSQSRKRWQLCNVRVSVNASLNKLVWKRTRDCRSHFQFHVCVKMIKKSYETQVKLLWTASQQFSFLLWWRF